MTKRVIKDMQKYVISVVIENILIRVSPHTPKTEKETRDNLIEEMADVLLNIEQLISLLGEDTNREIDIIQAYKTDRWWNRIFFGQNTNCNSENP